MNLRLLQPTSDGSPRDSQPGLQVSNDDFLRLVTTKMPAGQRAWVTQFPQDPSTEGEWTGQPYDPARPVQWRADCNTYMAIGSMLPGAHTRSNKNFGALLAIVLDDIGTKVQLDAPRPEPSWVIETSPGNFQYGYYLNDPITDDRLAARLIGGLVQKGGITDGGASGIVRYVRLPVGVNTKRDIVFANGGPWRTRLLVWDLNRQYSAQALADAFQMELTRGPGRRRADPVSLGADADPFFAVFRDLGLLNGAIGPQGDYGMTCPWTVEHSGGISTGTGTAYKPGGLWNCQHEHCRERRFDPDVLTWLQQEHHINTDTLIQQMPGAAGALLRALRRYVYSKDVGKFVDLQTADVDDKTVLDDYHFNVALGHKFSNLLLARGDLRRVERTTYRPGSSQFLDEDGRNAVNLWLPSNVKPAAHADASRAQVWLDHLAWLFPNEADRLLVLDFLTHLVQQRGVKVNWMLVLLSRMQGAGRDSLVTPIRSIIGQANISYVTGKQIESQFNDYVVRELVSASELDTTDSSRWQIYQKLKDIATTPPYHIAVNIKYLPERSMPKVANVLLLTNDPAALAIPDTDRRIAVAETPYGKEDIAAYTATGAFQRLHHAYAEPGWTENLYAYLQQRPISPTFDPKGHAPITPAKLRMMRAAEHPAKTQLREWMERREEPLAHDLFEARAACEAIWRDGYRADERLIHAFLRDLGAEPVGRFQDDGVQRRVWALRNVDTYKAKAQQLGALADAYQLQRRRGATVLDMDLLS
jgi:hypothetical protein